MTSRATDISAAAAAQAADIYGSLETGKNKNGGTKEAPLKNLWKALENAKDGDTIHLAEGVYPGKMKQNWFLIDKAVSIIGGYSKDFAERKPLEHRTMFQALNENNDKKGTGLGVFTIDFTKLPKHPEGVDMKFDGLIFDEGFANSYHKTKGKPEGFDTGMWLEGPAWNKTKDKPPSANRWSRLNDLADMGFGVRNNTGVEAEIKDNIIGLNVLTGYDNTKGAGALKKQSIDGNVFFLNRESDIQMTISPSIAKVRVDDFEDLEGTDGIESIEDNEDLKDPSVFKGRLNAQYLNAFLSMKYSESTKLDEGKCNGLRSMLGLPLQGTITTKCDMFCNRYPLEDALKLFGAMDGKGAQEVK